MSRGFDVFTEISSRGSLLDNGRVWLALEHLALYALHVDDYIARRPMCESLSVIGELRHYVQHHLMSPLDLVCQTTEGADLVSLAYLAGVVFSFLCVFPAKAAPFAKISGRMRRMLSARPLGAEGRGVSRLMTWILCMGTIASVESSDRTWFIGALDRWLSDQGIGSWLKLKVVLLDFLWLPMTNDRDGERIFEEVQDRRVSVSAS